MVARALAGRRVAPDQSGRSRRRRVGGHGGCHRVSQRADLFPRRAVKRVVASLAARLGRAGVLLVGVSESLMRFGTGFPARSTPACSSTARCPVSERIRVLVVDDSAFARKVLREVLTGTPDIEVVGIARDGLEALEKIAELKPDVVTLDLVMPNLDGIGVLRALPPEGGAARGHREHGGRRQRTRDRGAAAARSTWSRSPRRWRPIASTSWPTRWLARSRSRQGATGTPRGEPAADARPTPPHATHSAPWSWSARRPVGPRRSHASCPRFPADFPVPIVRRAAHPRGLHGGARQRLDAPVRDRRAWKRPRASSCGRAWRSLRAAVSISKLGGAARPRACASRRTNQPPAARPSVDVLFQSAAAPTARTCSAWCSPAWATTETSARPPCARAGGTVLTEAEASCVIYGMPRSVVESGNSDGSAALDDMAAAIRDALT